MGTPKANLWGVLRHVATNLLGAGGKAQRQGPPGAVTHRGALPSGTDYRTSFHSHPPLTLKNSPVFTVTRSGPWLKLFVMIAVISPESFRARSQ